jgi:glycosyltransferase involved in cell wall biosynthesis
LKILHINQYLASKGGVETYLLALLPLLKENGVDSFVAYAEGDSNNWKDSFQIPEIAQTGFSNEKRCEEKIEQLLQELKPDLIHIHNVNNIGPHKAGFAYGKTIHTSHDFRTICPANSFYFRNTKEVCNKSKPDLGCFTTTITKKCLTPRPQYSFYYFHRAKWLVENSTQFAHTIAPSTNTFERLSKAGYPKEKISVVPYFCSLEPYEKPRPIPEKKLITFLGRVAPNKGLEYFIEALSMLPEDYSGLMVGGFEDKIKSELTGLAKKLNCIDRVEFQPWASRDEVTQILNKTSVFVFPSLWPETLGIVGLEAMARGIPVVGSDIGGVREWLIDGQTGFLAKPKSAIEIKEGILKVTADNDTLIHYGEKALEHVKTKFSKSFHLKNLLEVYQKALSGT